MAKKKLFHLDPFACAVIDGERYEPGKDGAIEVPEDAVELLAPHGFFPEKPKAPEPSAAEKKSADLEQRVRELEALLLKKR